MKCIFQLQNDEECLVVNENEIYKRHYAMIDMMLKNREAQLAKLVDIQKKLEVAEKIEICRRIRVSRFSNCSLF